MRRYEIYCLYRTLRKCVRACVFANYWPPKGSRSLKEALPLPDDQHWKSVIAGGVVPLNFWEFPGIYHNFQEWLLPCLCALQLVSRQRTAWKAHKHAQTHATDWTRQAKHQRKRFVRGLKLRLSDLLVISHTPLQEHTDYMHTSLRFGYTTNENLL